MMTKNSLQDSHFSSRNHYLSNHIPYCFDPCPCFIVINTSRFLSDKQEHHITYTKQSPPHFSHLSSFSPAPVFPAAIFGGCLCFLCNLCSYLLVPLRDQMPTASFTIAISAGTLAIVFGTESIKSTTRSSGYTTTVGETGYSMGYD